MERRYNERRSFAPITQGEELDVKIEAVGAKGDGIAKIKGFVIFVPNAKEGETVRVKVTKVLRKVGFAEIVGQGSSNNETQSESKEESDDEEQEDNSEEENIEEES